jgi:site-specific DNA-methyltransferase (adenine-specific)
MEPYYEHGGVTLYHGDCLDVMATLPAGSVDLVVTSPPYNLGNTTGRAAPTGHYAPDAGLRKRGGGGKWNGGALADGYGAHNDNMPHEAYVAWQKEVLLACWRLLTPAGAIFYNHKPRILGGELVTPLDYNPGLPVRQIVIWARAGGTNFSPSFYLPTHEWIVILAKPGFRLKSKGASGVGDVWYIPQESNTRHPAPFPLALPLRAIETTGAATVLDPFAGSGTVLRAAKDLNCRAIGIELSEQYCRMAVQRLAQEAMMFAGAV